MKFFFSFVLTNKLFPGVITTNNLLWQKDEHTPLTFMDKSVLADGSLVPRRLVRDRHVGGMGGWIPVVKNAILAQPSRGDKNLTA